MNESIEVRRTIATPADRAWAIIRTGADVELWFGAITSCRREGNKRFCTMAGGGELSETITETDEAARIFAYEVEKHPLPVGPVRARMQVIASGAQHCEIVWSAAFDGEEAAVGQVAGMLEGLYAQGIADIEAFARKAA
jgi:uncharacterized protein YndB with AHSA1/START domain